MTVDLICRSIIPSEINRNSTVCSASCSVEHWRRYESFAKLSPSTLVICGSHTLKGMITGKLFPCYGVIVWSTLYDPVTPFGNITFMQVMDTLPLPEPMPTYHPKCAEQLPPILSRAVDMYMTVVILYGSRMISMDNIIHISHNSPLKHFMDSISATCVNHLIG